LKQKKRAEGKKMTDKPVLYNNVAPLANVARLAALIERCANRTHGLPGMGCFYGTAGYGKTTAGICATNWQQACHIQALPIGGAKRLLEMIVHELGLKPARSSPLLFNQAAEELAKSNRPLIIDEADMILRDTMIEVVRRLHDEAGVPVILMGENLLPVRLQRWERVHGRILAWTAAEPATLDDVKHLSAIYAPHVDIAADLRARLLTASRHSIRYISTNLDAFREFAAVRGLDRLTLADWGDTPFHTGEPPAIPRGPMMAPARRARMGVAA
jgi:DNA transposition AAA+ family ATPase